MEKEFEKFILGYYLHLFKIDEKWKDLSKTAERPLNSLKNQSEQLRLVSNKLLKDTTDIGYPEGLREKLIFKINVGIEDELSIILEIINQMNNANQELKSKLKKLENARSKIDPNSVEMKDIVFGTPLRPRMDLLMEWALDSNDYYDKSYSRIRKCMKALDCQDEESIDNLIKSFEPDKKGRANMDRILGFTQFIAVKNL
ncbi:uncharacterized protein LOC105688003 [Athalia rosae]|uniref:uncharacterized protein LOC105688003 n=1 Tax=Athalia rosae TaxID=37344 RepID=UPI00203480F5|nr:uncharacterized protein LOC105688003 [Athalia rosae]